ncbi:hypothetical protein C8R45DRAFT_937598 [Mycena sanguinolenta]|nr:hypothetical protein C8R45DRAFT_937598 [Mycena sanguinolenta]
MREREVRDGNGKKNSTEQPEYYSRKRSPTESPLRAASGLPTHPDVAILSEPRFYWNLSTLGALSFVFVLVLVCFTMLSLHLSTGTMLMQIRIPWDWDEHGELDVEDSSHALHIHSSCVERGAAAQRSAQIVECAANFPLAQSLQFNESELGQKHFPPWIPLGLQEECIRTVVPRFEFIPEAELGGERRSSSAKVVSGSR